MLTPENRFCCQERDKVRDKIEEGVEQMGEANTCITRHPGFQAVCLDPWVLETAFYSHRQEWGPMERVETK
jgi:hypothetical protein